MEEVKLYTRSLDENFSLSKALNKRISCRSFKQKSINLKELGNILWAGNGVNDKRYSKRRTAPSAGASYPIEMYAAIRDGGVYDLHPGIYHYNPTEHKLEKTSDNKITEDLADATFKQEFIKEASVNILIASRDEKTTQYYGDRGIHYVNMEAGAVSQNIHLEAVELELGTLMIGAFDDEAVKNLYEISDLRPLIIMPLGKPSDENLYK